MFTNPSVVADESSIAVEGALGVMLSNSKEEFFECAKDAAASLSDLLDDLIEAVDPDPLGTLSLRFDSGAVIRVYDSSSRYESYQIHYRDQTFVI